MRIILILTSLFLISCYSDADVDYKSTYRELLDEEKLVELYEHLQKWEIAEPENPELYIAYFNYFLRKGSEPGVEIKENINQDQESLVITDPETGKIMGYIIDAMIYDYEDINHAIEYLDRGLEHGPNRLDMHFGKIHLLNDIKDYKNASKALVIVLQMSIKNKNKWLWEDNESIDDGEMFLLKNILDYYRVPRQIARLRFLSRHESIFLR